MRGGESDILLIGTLPDLAYLQHMHEFLPIRLRCSSLLADLSGEATMDILRLG